MCIPKSISTQLHKYVSKIGISIKSHISTSTKKRQKCKNKVSKFFHESKIFKNLNKTSSWTPKP